MLCHIGCKPGPKLMHRDAAAIGWMQTRPPKLKDFTPRGFQRGQIIFVFGIEPACPRRHAAADQTVDTNRLRGFPVDKQQMIDKIVVLIDFKPVVMINQRAARTQFGDKDIIAQPLCRMKLRLGARQTDFELCRFCNGHELVSSPVAIMQINRQLGPVAQCLRRAAAPFREKLTIC